MRRLWDHVVLACAVVLFCGPVIWLVDAALHPDVIGQNWQSLTAQLSAESYGPELDRMVYVTFALAGTVSLMTALCGFLAAFVFVFCPRPFVRWAFWISLATLYFPVEARMLQTFDVIVDLGLTSRFAGLSLPVLQLGLATLYFRQHLKNLPVALFEAARLDGAGPTRAMVEIAFPLSLGAIGAVMLVSFIHGWNQYLWPLMASVDDRHWTLVRGLERLQSGSAAGLMLAALSLGPPLALIVLFRNAVLWRQ